MEPETGPPSPASSLASSLASYANDILDEDGESFIPEEGLLDGLKQEQLPDASVSFRLFLEDVEAAKTESPVTYRLSYPAIQTRIFMHKYITRRVVLCVLLFAYLAFLIAACIINWKEAQILLYMTLAVVLLLIWDHYLVHVADRIAGKCRPFFEGRWGRVIKWSLVLLFVTLILVWYLIDPPKMKEQGFGVLGTFLFILVTFLCSKAPHRVDWNPVFWGVGSTFVLFLFVLKTDVGEWVFSELSYQVATFLAFANNGAEFVFGEFYYLAFATFVLPVVIFFSAIVSLLYYVGLMQYVIRKFSWLMEVSLGTSGPESIVAAANIFVGLTEAPLCILPFLKDLTDSEMAAVIATGLSSIAGSVMGAYVAMDISPTVLIIAMVTSAPIGLAMIKIVVPETKESKFGPGKKFEIPSEENGNIVEAVANGAMRGLPLVLGIGTILVAFVSILAFIDAVVAWLGVLVGISSPALSVSRILGYVFWPSAYLMGVESVDCAAVAEMIGIRLFVNDFVAFSMLAEMIATRKAGDVPKIVEGVLMWLNPRSEAIATYAIACFSNFASVGMMLGGLSAMVPEKKSRISRLVIPALFASNMSAFVRASIAGALYGPD